MTESVQNVLSDINCAIIQFRGFYSAWAGKHGISYNEMLVLYTIRDYGFCTQKQICDQYLLPRQTINHVIMNMKKQGILRISQTHCLGKEKAFVLTEQGRLYAAPFLKSLEKLEEQAITILGPESLKKMSDAILAYTAALQRAAEEEEQKEKAEK